MNDDRLISLNAAIDAAIEAADDWDGGTNIGRQKRIEKAIKALPPANPTCTESVPVADCISRQAAIETVRKAQSIGQAHRMLLQLPPAQPSVSKTEMVGDTISRQAAIKAICEDGTMLERQGKYTMTMAERKQKDADILDTLPPAQPGWIPCDRELPKPSEEDGNGFHKAYLVQDGRWMDVARWDGKYWIAWGYSTVLLNVVAWMTLPKAWEGGCNA